MVRLTSGTPVAKVDPSGLYEMDVHYYLTYYLVRAHPCFSEAEAKQIAEGDKRTDEDPETSPGGFKEYQNATYHALHEGSHQPYLDNLWQEATHGHLPGRNTRNLGVYLHYLQDTFSHAGYPHPNIGHFFGRHSVDKTDSDVEKAMEMARATWDSLNRYAQETNKPCGCQPAFSGSIASTVRRFARSFGGGVIGRNLSTMEQMPELIERKRRILGVPRR